MLLLQHLRQDDTDMDDQGSALPPRAGVLREAEQLVTGDRNVSYGSPTQNFTNIAELWNTRFQHMLAPGSRFTAVDIADAMILLKVARGITQVKRDSYVDIAGYAACGWEAHSSAPATEPSNLRNISTRTASDGVAEQIRSAVAKIRTEGSGRA